eukprot:TRINITY_DN1031_c3_g1_i1.p1 TRINITY_DN1031_c3_g1~~TRINITY_DN1031_c3_g1_i1.p1  ORF type:complete len:465 (-),score=179.84 TRINITY_DN1031_c3_g1_i1:130-1503(-)
MNFKLYFFSLIFITLFLTFIIETNSIKKEIPIQNQKQNQNQKLINKINTNTNSNNKVNKINNNNNNKQVFKRQIEEEEDSEGESEEITDCPSQCSEFDTSLPVRATIGVYFTQFSELNPTGNDIWGSGYFWMYWPTCQLLNDAPFRPDDSVIIENSAQDWATTILPSDPCEDDPESECPLCNVPFNNYSYVAYKFNAILVQRFSYVDYPLDEQELFLAFEDLYSDSSKVLLDYDLDTGVHPTIVISGFSLESVVARHYLNEQKTSYGLKIAQHEDERYSKYSRVEIGIKTRRKPFYFIVKVLPPTIITLGTAVLILLLDPMRLDARLTTATTALLTEVFLALGLSENQPDVGVVTVIDWLFLWSYFIIFIIVLECTLISAWMTAIERGVMYKMVGIELDNMPGENEAVKAQVWKQRMKVLMFNRWRTATRIDRILAFITLTGSTIGTAIVILIAVYA